MSLDTDDVLRAELIQQLMCHGEVDFATLEQRHEIVFDDYFRDDLARLEPLVADGLVERHPRSLQVTSRGRLLLRIIAACFDRYLQQPQSEPARFSKAI